MDGEKPGVADETFDAVLSRLGLIYFPDRKGAMRAAHHAQGRRCQRDQSQTQWWNLLSLTALSITRLYGP